jgi:hypothetical protein
MSGEGEDARLVFADGRPLKEMDADRRVFHVLPKLYCPDAEDVRFALRSEVLGPAILPADGLKVGRPLPNNSYSVVGSSQTRYGWIVPLPDDVNAFDLQMTWWVRPRDECPYVIEHRIDIELAPGSFNAYSMDTSCWHRYRNDDVISKHEAFAVIDRGLLQDGRQTAIVSTEFDDGCYRIGMADVMTVPSVPVSDLWSIDEYQDIQLHGFEHAVEFVHGCAEHRQAACVEMPASVLVDAIELACAVPYDVEPYLHESCSARGRRRAGQRHVTADGPVGNGRLA